MAGGPATDGFYAQEQTPCSGA